MWLIIILELPFFLMWHILAILKASRRVHWGRASLNLIVKVREDRCTVHDMAESIFRLLFPNIFLILKTKLSNTVINRSNKTF